MSGPFAPKPKTAEPTPFVAPVPTTAAPVVPRKVNPRPVSQPEIPLTDLIRVERYIAERRAAEARGEATPPEPHPLAQTQNVPEGHPRPANWKPGLVES